MSVFCPHCKKRLILENYKIKSYHAVREMFTCGDITVEKTGHIVAPVMAGNVTVKGRLQGTVIARRRVRVTKTGALRGDVQAASLHIDAGAVLDGFLRIGIHPPPPDAEPRDT
ncbi:MAG: polymer-forming cytoskeletal protein [Phycisphaerae bacterium]